MSEKEKLFKTIRVVLLAVVVVPAVFITIIMVVYLLPGFMARH